MKERKIDVKEFFKTDFDKEMFGGKKFKEAARRQDEWKGFYVKFYIFEVKYIFIIKLHWSSFLQWYLLLHAFWILHMSAHTPPSPSASKECLHRPNEEYSWGI